MRPMKFQFRECRGARRQRISWQEFAAQLPDSITLSSHSWMSSIMSFPCGNEKFGIVCGGHLDPFDFNLSGPTYSSFCSPAGYAKKHDAALHFPHTNLTSIFCREGRWSDWLEIRKGAEFVAKLTDLPKESGLFELMFDASVGFIGKAPNLQKRLSQHQSNAKILRSELEPYLRSGRTLRCRWMCCETRSAIEKYDATLEHFDYAFNVWNDVDCRALLEEYPSGSEMWRSMLDVSTRDIVEQQVRTNPKCQSLDADFRMLPKHDQQLLLKWLLLSSDHDVDLPRNVWEEFHWHGL